ncbi:hypothetical protein [Spiroplasma endosymbiont of Polydrusus formosus]|uniref:hypothetical protein n=1 Tax=Spiroplasma endosymbiont of Polydrusus formosus TaxID=3139326 RepID=UPI0035B560D4
MKKTIGLFYNQDFDVLICYQPSATSTRHVINNDYVLFYKKLYIVNQIKHFINKYLATTPSFFLFMVKY